MINRSLSCLRRRLRTAGMRAKPSTGFPKFVFIADPPTRKGFLLEGQFNELLELLPTHPRPLILFLYWCGVRKGEALRIQWSQVDLNTRLIWLEPTDEKQGWSCGTIAWRFGCRPARNESQDWSGFQRYKSENRMGESLCRLRAWCAEKSSGTSLHLAQVSTPGLSSMTCVVVLCVICAGWRK